MTRRLAAFCAALLLAAAARAAGPGAGMGVALGEAELRYPDARLVEIEGFTDVAGDIPCKGRSYSRVWHYKYFIPSSGEWLIVNACGETFVNAAKHIPYLKSGEPTLAVPERFAAPAEVLRRLKEDKLLAPEPNRFSLDLRLQLRMHPARDGRPAGCYWTASQGKAAAMTDCGAEKSWSLAKGKPAAAGTSGSLKPAKKAKDAAGRYARVAVDYMKKKYPDARLLAVEALTDGTGSAKCVSPRDGWLFTFHSRTGGFPVVKGCGGKTEAELTDMDGRHSLSLSKYDALVLPFRDSDWALAQIAADCPHPTRTMRLANYKAGHSPAAGRSQVWTVTCGSQKHHVDALTGQGEPVGMKVE